MKKRAERLPTGTENFQRAALVLFEELDSLAKDEQISARDFRRLFTDAMLGAKRDARFHQALSELLARHPMLAMMILDQAEKFQDRSRSDGPAIAKMHDELLDRAGYGILSSFKTMYDGNLLPFAKLAEAVEAMTLRVKSAGEFLDLVEYRSLNRKPEGVAYFNSFAKNHLEKSFLKFKPTAAELSRFKDQFGTDEIYLRAMEYAWKEGLPVDELMELLPPFEKITNSAYRVEAIGLIRANLPRFLGQKPSVEQATKLLLLIRTGCDQQPSSRPFSRRAWDDQKPVFSRCS